MLPELQKFREKYPGYDDLDDVTLATKLASKYPEYGDLLEKVQSQPAPQPPEDKTFLKEFNAGIGRGFMKAGEGLKQRAMEIGAKVGLVEPESLQANQERLDKLLTQAPEAKTWKGKAGEIVGESIPYAAIPGGAKGGIVRRLVTAAGAGATVGALQPTKTNESAAVNAGIGAVAGGVGSAGMTALGKVINAIRKPTQNAIQGEFDRAGVRASLGDITQNPRIRKAETWLEDVPGIGLWKYRKEQGEEVQAVAKKLLTRYIIDPTAKNVREVNRQYADSLFQNLEGLVSQIPEQKILPTETKGLATELSDQFTDIFKRFQNTKLEGLLKDIIGGTKDKITKTKTYNYSTMQMEEMTKREAGTVNWKEIWNLRDGLGDLIGQAKKKITTGDVNQTELGQLEALYATVNKDIQSWTQKIGRPDIKNLVTIANDSYKDLVVKYGLIEDAFAKASAATSAKEVFSPKTFSTELKKIARAQEKGRYNLFTPKEIDELTGTANIMQYAKRAGEFMENPPTGNRWGLPTIAGGVAGYAAAMGPKGLALGGGVVGMAGLARWLTTTESGKRFALAASKMEPDSLVMKSLMGMAYQQAAKLPAIAATNE